MTKTLFTKFLIIVLLVGILVPVLQPARADDSSARVTDPPVRGEDLGGNTEKGSEPCSSFWGFEFKQCFLRVVGYVLEFVLNLESYLLSIAGWILDIVIRIQNDSFYNQPLVNIGWKIARDVVNIFPRAKFPLSNKNALLTATWRALRK